MDFNNTNNQNHNPYGSPFPNQPQYVPSQKSPADGLISAAMILGISAIVSAFMMTVYFPFVLGSISIILALLSKGHGNKLADKARTGIICSTVAIVLNIFIVVGSLYTVFSSKENFQQFDYLYEQIYGESFSDMYEELTGEEFFY